MSTWNKKNFSIYTSDERSALGLIEELGNQTNYNTEELEKVKESDNKKVSHDEMSSIYKIDKNADFTGSWHGIKKPTASQEGLQATVDKIVEEDIPNINSQLETIATVGDVNNINMLIALGIKRFKLPSGRIKVNNTIELIGDVEIYGNKDTILYAENDLSILSTKKDGQIHSNIYIHDLQISQEYQGLATNLPIDLENANMCRIERVLCNSTNTNMNSVTGLKVYNTTNSHVYSLLMDKCDFRNSTVDIEITDCYISNTNIWGVNRQYALHLGKSSQQLENVQLVGGDINGALWIEDIQNGYNVEIIKASNIYIDGSYDNIRSGSGIKANGLRYSDFNNISIWYPKKEGLILKNSFGNNFNNITFEGCSRDNVTGSSFNNSNYADIVFIGSIYDNKFNNITFVSEGDYYIKPMAIKCLNATTFEGHYNKFSNMTIVDKDKYNNEPYNFSFDYLSVNCTGLNNHLENDLIIKNGVINVPINFKTSLVYSHDTTVNNINGFISPNGQAKTNYLVCNNGYITDLGANVETGITTGTITLEVYRNDEILTTLTMDSTSPYFKIINFNDTNLKIYKNDLLKIKLITSSDLNNCNYLTVTLNITQ